MKCLIVILSVISLIILLIFCAFHTQPDKATKLLTDAGYTKIEITGTRFFMCSSDDDFATGFKAESSKGKKLSGAVCSGILKGATIRFD